MSDDIPDRIRQLIERSRQPLANDSRQGLAVGQVRQVRPLDASGASMLVLIVGLDNASLTANVVVATSPADRAADRDVIWPASTSGLNFDLVFRSQGVGTVWQSQLQETPLASAVPAAVLDVVGDAGLLSRDELVERAVREGLIVGASGLQTGDPLWWAINDEAERLRAISSQCHETLLTPPAMDPMCLPLVISRGDDDDLDTFVRLRDCILRGEAVHSPEGLEAFWDALDDIVDNPDARRLFSGQVLLELMQASDEAGVRAPTPEWHDPDKSLEIESAARTSAIQVRVDPLIALVARDAREGRQCTRIITSQRLRWNQQSPVGLSGIDRTHSLIFGFIDEDVHQVVQVH